MFDKMQHGTKRYWSNQLILSRAGRTKDEGIGFVLLIVYILGELLRSLIHATEALRFRFNHTKWLLLIIMNRTKYIVHYMYSYSVSSAFHWYVSPCGFARIYAMKRHYLYWSFHVIFSFLSVADSRWSHARHMGLIFTQIVSFMFMLHNILMAHTFESQTMNG